MSSSKPTTTRRLMIFRQVSLNVLTKLSDHWEYRARYVLPLGRDRAIVILSRKRVRDA